MRYGRGMSGTRRRSNVTAPICPMNCTRIRVVINASITMPSDTNPARMERTPSTTSETLGNPWDGCRRANTLKK